jgi:non-canonical purine NTP pyrophosphatase (RdgB/HAM1 family)
MIFTVSKIPPHITFITGNPSKAKQLSLHLNLLVHHRKVDLPEIQSLDLLEIVTHKTRAAYELVKTPVLVEDTSLTFHALGKLPGPLIKWFLTELDNDGLAKILNGYTDRSAKAEVLFGLYDGNIMRTFSGSINGTIADTPRGETGFGWDPIFIPEGYNKTWGEMDAEEQKETSMRRIALKQLESFLISATPGDLDILL